MDFAFSSKSDIDYVTVTSSEGDILQKTSTKITVSYSSSFFVFLLLVNLTVFPPVFSFFVFDNASKESTVIKKFQQQ